MEKAGTTSLFDYLGQHPEICAPQQKELNYFVPAGRGDRPPPLSSYTRHYGHCNGEPYRLEASPTYWYVARDVLPLLRQTLPSPRVIISLRDPVSRMYSAYTYLVSLGRLHPSTTLRAYAEECARSDAPAAERGADEHTPLSIGRYDEYLQPWLDAFDDACLRVVFAEELFSAAPAVLRTLCEWLDISPDPVDGFELEVRNDTIHPRSFLLARGVDAARRTSRRAIGTNPRLRRGLRRVYELTNRSLRRGDVGRGPLMAAGLLHTIA